VIATDVKLSFTSDMKQQITLTMASDCRQTVSDMSEVITKGKTLNVEIKQHRAKRSLDSNAYLWILLQKIASALNTSKDDVYLHMLERYGVFTHIVVKLHAVDKFKENWRTVKDLGEIKIGGGKGRQLQCYFGSSSYDSKEFSVLIDGVVSECKEMGIETLPEEELQSMKESWGR